MIVFFENHKRNIQLLLALTVAHLIFYGLVYGFRSNNDTDSFIMMINFFRGTESGVYWARYLNPFYPVISTLVLPFLSAAQSIVVINIVFYVGIVLLTYGLIRRVFKNNTMGFVTALLMLSSYALIRYGLTQVQDMGGYFWLLLTAYTGWRWYEDRKWHWLVLGGISTAFGILTKESGAMGALFFGIVILVANRKAVVTSIKQIALFSILPALTIVINGFRGKDIAYNSADWFMFNWRTFYDLNYTPFKWAAINFTTFNFLWVLFALGAYWLVTNRKNVSFEIKLFLAAIIPASFSYMAWPLFISRTVFVCAWFIVPVAAYALWVIYEKGKKKLAATLLVVALLTPYIFQSFIGYTPVFLIWEQVCHRNIPCAVSTFFKSRANYDVFVQNAQNYVVK